MTTRRLRPSAPSSAGLGVAVTELRDPLGTHRSVNLVGIDGTRRNYFDARGSGRVAVDLEACRATLRGAALLHCHLDDWCRQLLPVARDEGLPISCDLQDAIDADDAYRADFVAAADVLFISAANLSDPARVAQDLAARRPGRVVVVGAGDKGCLVALEGHVETFPAIDLPRPVVDTNGAGDTLAATFLASYLVDELGLARSVRRAQLAARWICSQRGDEKAPLPRARLEALEAAATSPA